MASGHRTRRGVAVDQLVQTRLRSPAADLNPDNVTISSLLRQDRSIKAGVKAKRLRAGWDEAYLLKILMGYDAIALPRQSAELDGRRAAL